MPEKYEVEWFNHACYWEWMGDFFMKSQAIAYIRSSYRDEAEYQAGKRDWRIIVRVSF